MMQVLYFPLQCMSESSNDGIRKIRLQECMLYDVIVQQIKKT